MTLPADPVKWAVTAFKDGRTPIYDRYDAYLAGDQPIVFASKKFRSAFGPLFLAFSYNRCSTVVDAHADRMRVSGFGADDAELAKRAQEIWDENRMDVREGHIYSDQFALGDAYVIAEMHPTQARVQYWVQSPRSVRVHWDGETPDALDLGTKVWFDDDEHCRLNLYFRDRVEKYISINRAPSGVPTSPNAFTRFGEDDSWRFALNVPDTVPIFHIANNGRTNSYGVSELRPVLPLQDALNKTLMDKLVAMEFAAFPQRVLIGVDPPISDEDEAQHKEMLKRFEGGIDRVWAMSQGNIAEFSAANLAQYLAVAEFWEKSICRVTKVPVHYLDMTGGGFVSGRALQLAEGPFGTKIEDRQKGDGSVLAAMSEYGMRLEGKEVKPGTIRVNWHSAFPRSEEDDLDLALQKQVLGLPFETILQQMGYDPDQIKKIKDLKKQAADEARAAFDRGDVNPLVSMNRDRSAA